MWHDVEMFKKKKIDDRKHRKAHMTGLKANNRLQNMDSTENLGEITWMKSFRKIFNRP